jgi:hypothetical protein
MIHMYTFGDSSSTPTGATLSADYDAFLQRRLDPNVLRNRVFQPAPEQNGDGSSFLRKTHVVLQKPKASTIQFDREMLAAAHLSNAEVSTSFPAVDVIGSLMMSPQPFPLLPPLPQPQQRLNPGDTKTFPPLPPLPQSPPRLNPSDTKTFPPSPFDFKSDAQLSPVKILRASENGCLGDKCRCQQLPVMREFVSCKVGIHNF